MKERFGYDDAARARDFIVDAVEKGGEKADQIQDGLILGSGLGQFTENHIDNEGGIDIDFSDIYTEALGIDEKADRVEGHARKLVIGALRNDIGDRLVIAQSGREHPYEGVPTKRSVFWVRVMQLLGVKTLIGSNAAGILTPDSLQPPAIMPIHSDQDFGHDNPLIGKNDERFGPRFPHMGDLYPQKTRDIIKKVAEDQEMDDIREGMYIRMKGPNYERATDVYRLRALLQSIWNEGAKQAGENRFSGKPVGVVGMSSTFEQITAQHATQSEEYPAFQDGRAYISVATNYSASLGPNGFVTPSNHDEVKEMAGKVEERFGKLVEGVILQLRSEI
ncbi:purine-nucleoside phosphorylase [Candidatus Pacearchaeota archaeon]|nr:purine-nucleoside phosphorylase [Candidatus Pacearchaeota archaeon]